MKTMHSRQTMENDSRITGEPIPNILLRSARKQNGWTQQEVAKKLQVGVASVGRWERGEVAPNRYDRDLLCELFHRSAEELGFPDGQEIPISSDSQESDQAQEEAHKSNHPPFHEQLRRERVMRGWSQADLAEKVGSDPKAIGRWESGKSIPLPYYRQALYALFGKNAEEFGLAEPTPGSGAVPVNQSASVNARPFRTTRTFSVDLSVHCGDCEQPGITGILETMVIDPSRDCTTFYFRFTNRTAEDAGLKFDSLSLTAPNGDFFLGRSVGSFLLGAGQSIPLSVVFDWIPQRKTVYRLNVVLIRPDRWRNTYRPISLTV